MILCADYNFSVSKSFNKIIYIGGLWINTHFNENKKLSPFMSFEEERIEQIDV